ncbi:MAG: endonuclease [Synergistaceae bacterium]|nr:endonuclease [Synergistaceae bacterium]
MPIDEIDEWAKAVLRGDTSFLEERAVERSAARPDRSFPGFVIAGSGTGSAKCIRRLASSGLRVEKVPESFSTLRGRDLYWRIHPPRGFHRLVPKGLLVPPRDVDDLAAWSLILEFIGGNKEMPCNEVREGMQDG